MPNTNSGLIFEKKVTQNQRREGIRVDKHSMYRYLISKNINWQDFISSKLLPDDAYYNEDTNELFIYEVKFQQCDGSVDEKLQTVDFKIKQYQKLWSNLNTKVYFTYLLNDWFLKNKYRDVLEYIKTIPNCNYKIL